MDSAYKNTNMYMPNFLLEHNRPKIMDSDSPYVITYVYIWPEPIYLLYSKKKSKNRKKNLKIDLGRRGG